MKKWTQQDTTAHRGIAKIYRVVTDMCTDRRDSFSIHSLFFFARSQPFQSIKITKISGTHNARIGSMSPDGNYLTYVLNSEGNESLWLRDLASESNVQIKVSRPGIQAHEAEIEELLKKKQEGGSTTNPEFRRILSDQTWPL